MATGMQDYRFEPTMDGTEHLIARDYRRREPGSEPTAPETDPAGRGRGG